MSGIIELLPDNIANQIAAGEVIQRPASVVKELMENAVDAGADDIQLIIKDAGKTLIQIIDNGSGMSPLDARMCFERHATSKIKVAKDLFDLHTKGFRGEALASIAAIAQVEMKTRLKENDLGTEIHIADAKVSYQEACQSPSGTSIAVKNLFFNVPARRNFLKSNPVETRHIIEEFNRVALAHPEIAFQLFHNGIEIYHLNKGNLRQRIVQILGKAYNERLVPIEEETDFLKIKGFIGKPQFSKRTRGEQYFFVNNRFIKSAYLNHAVNNAYAQVITKEQYPLYYIFIDIDPSRIDINVHPTKQEIKFDDEKVIYAFIHAGVRHALGQFSLTPSIDFEQEAHIQHNTTLTDQEKAALSSKFDGGSFINKGIKKDWSSHDGRKAHSGEVKGWKDLYEIANNSGSTETLTVQSKLNTASGPDKNELALFDLVSFEPVQVHQKYILTQLQSGIILIDQHAAHVRILFEKNIQRLALRKRETQQQLFPVNINLNAADALLLKSILPEINAFGFDIQEFGQNSFVLHGSPSGLKIGNEQQMIESLLSQYKANLEKLNIDKRSQLAYHLASHTAIRQGEKLDKSEMQALIDELFACEVPYLTPGGRLTFITFGLRDLEQQFENKIN